MQIILLILGLILLIAGVARLVRGGDVLWGVVLIVLGLVVAPGGWVIGG